MKNIYLHFFLIVKPSLYRKIRADNINIAVTGMKNANVITI